MHTRIARLDATRRDATRPTDRPTPIEPMDGAIETEGRPRRPGRAGRSRLVVHGGMEDMCITVRYSYEVLYYVYVNMIVQRYGPGRGRRRAPGPTRSFGGGSRRMRTTSTSTTRGTGEGDDRSIDRARLLTSQTARVTSSIVRPRRERRATSETTTGRRARELGIGAFIHARTLRFDPSRRRCRRRRRGRRR